MASLRVVVTGATGNIGTSVVHALGEDERIASVLGIARRMPQWSAPKLEIVRADLARDELTELFTGSDVVIHLGWLFQPTHNPLVTWSANVLGSMRVFDAAARAGVGALIYSSSVGAYSPGDGAGAVPESWPTHGWPDAAYTREKSYVERVLDVVEQQNPQMRVVRIRPGFVFKRESASEQRRLFAGPLVPAMLAQPRFIPFVPGLPGLRVQTVHASDLAQAFRLATVSDVAGAYNVASQPAIDTDVLADMLGARSMRVPTEAVRGLLAVLWRLHLVPASPGLFQAVCRLPLMDTTRAREHLGWRPRYSATETIAEFLEGFRDQAGMATPPLTPKVPGGRLGELATGIGQRADVPVAGNQADAA